MNYDCDLIRDVAGLHQDGALSENSRRIVGEHLSGCPECRAYYEAFREEATMPVLPEPEPDAMDLAAGLRAYRRGQVLCFGAFALMMLTLLLPWAGIMGVNGISGISLIFHGQPGGFLGMGLLTLGIWYPFQKRTARLWCGWCGWAALLGAEVWSFLTVPAGYVAGVDFGVFSLDIPAFERIDPLESFGAFLPGFYISLAATILLGFVFHRFTKVSG